MSQDIERARAQANDCAALAADIEFFSALPLDCMDIESLAITNALAKLKSGSFEASFVEHLLAKQGPEGEKVEKDEVITSYTGPFHPLLSEMQGHVFGASHPSPDFPPLSPPGSPPRF